MSPRRRRLSRAEELRRQMEQLERLDKADYEYTRWFMGLDKKDKNRPMIEKVLDMRFKPI